MKEIIEKGKLYYATSKDKRISNAKIFYVAKLKGGKYLFLHPKLFVKDPIDFQFAITTKEKYLECIKGYNIQVLPPRLSKSS